MNFNEIYSLVLREPSKQMDDFTLIAEIEKRPDLWRNPNKRSKVRIDLWKDVAKSVGTNVRACKSKWGKLRRFYHMEEKNTQQRIEQLINSGKYNHKQNYNSRWIYFEHMKFLSEIPADSKFGENSDSDEGSNFSDTENTDDDFEIELLIEDSLSETENDNETKNYDKPPTQTYDKNQNAASEITSSSHAPMNTLSPCDKSSEQATRNAQFQNMDKIRIKQEPSSPLDNDNYPLSSEERSNALLSGKYITQIFPNVTIFKIPKVIEKGTTTNPVHNQIPSGGMTNFDMLPKSINVSTNMESNKNTMSNRDMPPRSISVAGTSKEVNKNAKFNYDMLPGCISVSTNQEVNTKNVNRPKDNAELNKKGNIFVRQDIQTNACIVDKQNTSVLQGGRNCTITSNLLPSLEENLPHSNNEASNPSPKGPVAPMAPITSHTNENTINNNISNNNESVKSVQFSNAEIVHIKEEPADVEEINNAPQNTNINPTANTTQQNIASNSPSPKRLRLADTSLMSKQKNTTITRINEAPTSSTSSCNAGEQDSTKLRENTTYCKTGTDLDDLDCNFLVSFLSHMKSMTQLQNLRFRAQMSNLMLSISSLKEITGRNTANNLENREQTPLLRAVVNIGDSDGNFLVSFLPHLKSMSRLQNLQFRAQMSELVLNIFSTSVFANYTVSDSTT